MLMDRRVNEIQTVIAGYFKSLNMAATTPTPPHNRAEDLTALNRSILQLDLTTLANSLQRLIRRLTIGFKERKSFFDMIIMDWIGKGRIQSRKIWFNNSAC
jgi:hypothetical protein